MSAPSLAMEVGSISPISRSSWLDFGMSYVSGSIGWRLPIAVQTVFALVQMILIFGVPESPRWLFTQGRDAEAVEVLSMALGTEANDPMVLRQKNQIVEAMLLEEHSGKASPSKMFKRDQVHTRTRVLLAFGAHVSPRPREPVRLTDSSVTVHEPNGWYQFGGLLHTMCVW